MTENTQNENKAITAEAQNEAAQTSDAQVATTGSTKVGDELSEDDLEAVAGGLVTSSPPSDEFR